MSIAPQASSITNSATASMIRLDAVSKSFDRGASFAVQAVSLDIPRGSFVALVGGSGSGKTTTLKMINRLIAPDAGQVYIAGSAADAQPEHELRRRIGYVFQGIGLFPHLTVAENIGITLQLLRRTSATIEARTRELLTLVDLPAELATRLPQALSGGQRQRVGVARALAAEPQIMLMDEPFGALDPLTRDALGTEYRRLHDRLGLTTLLVTHDVMEAVLLADRILVMRAGSVVADGSPRTLLEQRADADVERLMDMPRRQAARVQALLDAAGS